MTGDYALLAVSALLFSLMFLFNGSYQKSRGTGLDAVLAFSVYTGIASVLLLFLLAAIGAVSAWSVLSAFALSFSLFSFLLAILAAAVNIGFSYFALKALGEANLSLFSIFAMLGGMLLPSLYGILFREEPLTAGKALAYLLLAIALALTFERGGRSKGAAFYYGGVFLMNGLSGVVSALHQGNPVEAVSSGSFLLLSRAVTAALCLAWFLVKYKKFPPLRGRECGSVTGNALCSTLGNLLVLIALLRVQASVQYPMITGGTMIFSTAISFLLKEKPRIRTVLSSLVAAAATVCMMF